ncbi:MAG: hypothetical protein AABY95_03740 [Pseudomonadota bacterium]
MNRDILHWLNNYAAYPLDQTLIALVEHARENSEGEDKSPSLLFDGMTARSLLQPVQTYLNTSGGTFGWGEFELETAMVAGQWHALRERLDIPFEDSRKWWVLSFGQGENRESDVQVYPDMNSQESLRRSIQKAEEVPPAIQSVLEQLAVARGVPDALENEISKAIQKGTHPHPTHVAVYDVGQGNCNAACDSRNAPIVYFDYGRPLSFNKHTAPHPWPGFCFTERPPVVLSHWDFDHWGAVQELGGIWNEKAINSDWIAPRQYVSPTHLRLINHLHKRKKIHFWPAKKKKLNLEPLNLAESCHPG